jgi:hypothetical protein
MYNSIIPSESEYMHTPIDQTTILQSSIAATPTPVPDYVKVPMEAPTGWVIAGALVVILVFMLFQSLKKWIISLLRKPKN